MAKNPKIRKPAKAKLRDLQPQKPVKGGLMKANADTQNNLAQALKA